MDADVGGLEEGHRAVGEFCGEGAAGSAGEHDVVSMDAGGVRWAHGVDLVDDSGNWPRIAWSFRAEGMVAPGSTAITGSAGDGAGNSERKAGKDVA